MISVGPVQLGNESESPLVGIGAVENEISLARLVLDEVQVGEGATNDASIAERLGDGFIVLGRAYESRDLEMSPEVSFDEAAPLPEGASEPRERRVRTLNCGKAA